MHGSRSGQTVVRGDEMRNILSIGLGDLVSARKAALRLAGFDVTAAICLEDVSSLRIKPF